MIDSLPWRFELMDDGFTFKFDDASHAGYARKLFVHYLGGQVSADTDLFGVEMVFCLTGLFAHGCVRDGRDPGLTPEEPSQWGQDYPTSSRAALG